MQQGNCFLWIEDYEQAQKLMNQQLEMNWAELLNGFAGQLNPEHESIFEPISGQLLLDSVTNRNGPPTLCSVRRIF